MANTLTRIEEKLENIDPASTRGRVLVALRNFRTSWIVLGRHLRDVAYGGDYREWGYGDYDEYCARELGLKRPTVRKLLLSYQYMQARAPERLEQAEENGADVPDYRTLAELETARTCNDLDEDALERVHEKVMAGELDDRDARAELKKIRAAAAPSIPGMEDDATLRQLIGFARRVRKTAAQCRRVPDGLRDRIELCLVELEDL